MKNILALLGIALLCSGCAAMAPQLAGNMFSSHSSGSLEIHQATSINLGQANYFIVKTNVMGKSKGFSLLGFITLVPAQYQKAADRMYAKAEIQPGTPQALGNLVMEKTSAYWILFSIPKVTVRADVIEFVPPGKTNVVMNTAISTRELKSQSSTNHLLPPGQVGQ